MSFPIDKTLSFRTDASNQFRWYEEIAGVEIAWRFYEAVQVTLYKISQQPEMGYMRRFRNPRLRDLRSFRLDSPFQKLLIFYRTDDEAVHVLRLVHGSRDLERRLGQPSMLND